ncbi:hypothetical protein EKPJFOCH_0664 [Methylobacterium thuringiense]|uniref:HEXXH motif domain-containing protein n=2 Tax=Methylobacterium thuringiense TaxID=1003091 RepID=A0ABQ4TGP5_9HYPH|nr:hypothetical protein EKPJFOCH_0664 [Methylobacterium thuringiense]
MDGAIRRALDDSVARVLDEAARHDLLGDGADRAAWHEALLATRGAPPQLWACYHDLVQAILRGDADAVPALAADLLARRPDRAGQPGTIVTISDADLGRDDAFRYRAVIDSDPGRPLNLQPVEVDEVRRIQALVDAGRALLDRTDPALLDEIDTLGHQIVLATNASGGFGGAATVFLWGAVILNPDRVPDRVTLVESLAHETAHALLFGMTLGADLTTNDPSERYGSPLRPDPRPIEGIVHATYVLARMNYCLERLREHPELSPAERASVATKIARNTASYAAGLETVVAHARFTPDGAAIFAACREAMAGNH